MYKSTEIRFCPHCGASIKLAEKFGKIMPYCEPCNWASFSDPKVAAAVVVISPSGVLLVQRKNKPSPGKWTLPGGFVDGGEDPRRAAERECFEETGITVQVTGLFDIFYGKEHQNGADIVLVYRAELTGGIILPGDDAVNAGWFSSTDHPELAFDSTERILSSL